ncbi:MULTISPECIES: LacI family DNA-binding transcriptional regulator [unclassified Streptomyces]|uniref:LacI family DNA-binding transcriptional regulator n=1 Tax=Streptomyces evansiae TaxID=3075535 RepID=A0ABD5E5X7_9ACTN|nr:MULTISPECIES: LacI family DNA-binding transcriptional regulator [unclassified Streptomyces]ASY31308.1 LacI family transcriptional regulator [Streptomyces sp. CLI2509]EFL04260.1 transcriptional regulator [Streptomyces sp. SPB78]EGJ72832.1 putative transcriptional regulator [Streptomyces sp. Tu6071]MDT0416774.1 LacI family DNA-binding transcriptional regulator [Streptomyces sp. DSM 41982]MDT0423876.1 LacI family DNA-binding transcriptional regulator [Streptomyces sp. DSM 41859]
MSREPQTRGRAATLEDVARVAGVSRATVSRVVNGVRNVDPGIQSAVREAITATGYTPNRAARSLVTRKAGTVALVVSGAGDEGEDTDPGFAARVFADPFFGRAVSGIIGYLRPHSLHPVLLFAETEAARAEAIAYLRQGSADGALVVTTHPADPLPARIADTGVPAVLFARPALPVPLSYVDLAHRDGAALAAAHLLARGRRTIATITGPLDVLAGQERFTGFREAMARHGHAWVPFAEGGFTLASGETAMRRLLDEHPGLDGVFAANDLMAQGACQVLRERGRRVPADVSVVGFDDSTAAVTANPPLTTIRQPVEEMAAEMARLLHTHIESGAAEPVAVVFDPELVIRASS